ncbi:MAG TPA: hypothetical protein VEK34_13470 [Methylocella sp.]|nr:hypothetical protein [Methylocella sp.]
MLFSLLEMVRLDKLVKEPGFRRESIQRDRALYGAPQHGARVAHQSHFGEQESRLQRLVRSDEET